MDRAEFNRFVDGRKTPMQVVTTATADERAGCLLAFATEVSLEPPRYLVSLSRKNRTHDVAVKADLLAVHLLRDDQHDLAELFGSETGDEVDKFDRCSSHPGPGGVPLLDDCPRLMVGRVVERYDWHDHTGHLLEPIHLEVQDGEPGLDLTDVDDLEPGHPG